MKRFIILFLFSTSLTFGYGLDNDDSGYKSDSGKRYQYDLNQPMDKIGYSTDISAQRRDEYDRRYNNYDHHIENDRRSGQYGGGVYDDY